MKLKTLTQFEQKDPCTCGGNCGCGGKPVNEKFNFSKKEVEAAANLIASAISQADKVKAKVHDLEYDKGRGAGFEISIDGEKYDGGSYVVKDNGDVVNAAIGNSHPNAVYNTIGNKDIADVFINMEKYESVTEVKRSMVSGTSARTTSSLEDRKYELKKDVEGAKIGDFINVTLPKGTIIYNLPGGVFADHFSLKNKYASKSSRGPQYFDKPTFKGIQIISKHDTLAAIEDNGKVLESVVNEAKFKKGQNIKSKVDSDDFNGDVYDRTNEVDGSEILKNSSFEIYEIGKDEVVLWSDADQVEYSIDPDDLKNFVKESVVIESKMDKEFKAMYAAIEKHDLLMKIANDLFPKIAKEQEDGVFVNFIPLSQEQRDEVYTELVRRLKLEESVVTEAKKYKFNDLAKAWQHVYGEDMEDEYEGFYQEVVGKYKNKVTKADIATIWSHVYGEEIADDYDGFYNELKENLEQVAKLEKLDNLNEQNADGTISDDEDDRLDDLLGDVEMQIDELIQHAKTQAYEIGGDFRGPGMTSQLKKLMLGKLKRMKN